MSLFYWTQNDGGPRPADDVWLYVIDRIEGFYQSTAQDVDWPNAERYRVLNQHLIDAARLEGIRLGLEAAAKEADKWQMQIRPCDRFVDDAIRALDPEAIAREAVLDQLVSEAQEQGMGYETEADQ